MSHLAHWSDYSMPSPHGLDFHGLLGYLLDGLRELGVVSSEQVVFACMPSLGRRGGAAPPDDLLLDRAAAAEHHAALVSAGCLVVEIRGAGWLPGRRYLVLLDHAWNGGAASTFPVVWAEARGTVWPVRGLVRAPRAFPGIAARDAMARGAVVAAIVRHAGTTGLEHGPTAIRAGLSDRDGLSTRSLMRDPVARST